MSSTVNNGKQLEASYNPDGKMADILENILPFFSKVKHTFIVQPPTPTPGHLFTQGK